MENNNLEPEITKNQEAKPFKVFQNQTEFESFMAYSEENLKSKIENDIKERGLENFVFLKGSASDLNKRYPKYSFFVQSSYYEGFSLTLLEARLSGLPTVSFDCPTGPKEIIDHNLNGVLVPSYDVEKLALSVCEMIENKEKRIEMAKHSKDGIDKFSKERIKEQWLQLINELS